ncbi:MAG: tetratricopeptide repeat protein, partial [bacterium]
MGRNQEAIDLFRQSLALNPRQPHVHNNLGGALAAAGVASEAEPHYRRAIELKPDYTEARYNLALLLMDKDPETARTLLRAVTSAGPTFGPGWEALSIVLGKLDDR